MADVIALGKTGPHEHAPEMHVIGDVTAGELGHRNAERALEDLHSHGGLLLGNAGEGIEARSQVSCSGGARPDLRRISSVPVHHYLGRVDHPARHLVGEAMELGLLGERRLDLEAAMAKFVRVDGAIKRGLAAARCPISCRSVPE